MCLTKGPDLGNCRHIRIVEYIGKDLTLVGYNLLEQSDINGFG